MNTQISQLEGKKDKLLELSIANAITIQEFKKRNNRFNEQIADMQEQMISLQKLEENGSATSVDLSAIEKALWRELSFQDTISTEVVAAILDHVVVCEGSTKQRIDLELYLRLGQTASVTFHERDLHFGTHLLHNMCHKAKIPLNEDIPGLRVPLSQTFQPHPFLTGGKGPGKGPAAVQPQRK